MADRSPAAQGAGAALVMPLAMAILSAHSAATSAPGTRIFQRITGCALIVGPHWRLHHRKPWLALDLLDQPADRHDRDRTGAGTAARELRACCRARRPRIAARRHRGAGTSLGPVARPTRSDGPTPRWQARCFPAFCARPPSCSGNCARCGDGADAAVHSRSFAAGVSASFLFYAAMYGVLFLLPQFLQISLGFGAFALDCASCHGPQRCS